MTLQTIELKAVLPDVFGTDEHEAMVRQSQVWLEDLKLERGSYYLLAASSGSGKSSLCSYIYGNRRDYSGKILFDGENVRKFTMSQWCELRRTSLALLPQEMRLFPELTVMENIEIKNALTHSKNRQEIMGMLERLEIADKADVLAAHISIGQQQRVAIVRALCQPFTFLLLDEPVSHLDERNNRMAASLIYEEASRQGAAVVATSVGNPLLMDVDWMSINL